jgi:hypothetical protein
MKFRQYSIVFHNVDKQKCYQVLGQYVKEAKEYVVSVEAYPQGDGSHAHLFIQYKNQRSFKSVLKELEVLKKKFIVPRPPGEERDWGRVQLDVMRGRFNQAEAYLNGETKDKPTGEVLCGALKPCWRRFRYKKACDIGARWYKGCIEEYCSKCNSNLCMGCCEGCVWCDDEVAQSQGFTQEQRDNHKKYLNKERKKWLNGVFKNPQGGCW